MTGIYVGKFFPLHNGHINCINSLIKICDKVYVVFYNNPLKEAKLNQELSYSIDERIMDAKEIFKNDNVEIVNYNVNPNLIFPKDYLKIKEEILNVVGIEKFDIQVFGQEEEEIYKNYIYADRYIAEPLLLLPDNKSFHATLVRNNYLKYRKYLPEIVRNRLDKKYANKIIICVSGKSGSGKSTLSKYILDEYDNSIHIDIDKLAHQALEDEYTKKKVIEITSNSILDESNKIDRRKLGNIVFNNKQLQDKVYNQTWIYMNSIIKKHISNRDNLIIILDWYNIVNKEEYWNERNIKIITNREYNTRKEYVIARDNITEDYFELREKNALTYDELKIDLVINMEDNKRNIMDKIDNLFEKSIKN
ncbi:MAG: dephospho-CoA kinase [Ignavibacteriales bacterium]